MVNATIRRWMARLICASALLSGLAACRGEPPKSSAPGPEPIARTEFTERIENFFEYEPLVPGRPSAFLIHLTDLADGSPVEKADVTLTLRREGETQGIDTKAKVGRVTGIYVAHVTVSGPGRYRIDFRVRTATLDERMTLDDFTSGG